MVPEQCEAHRKALIYWWGILTQSRGALRDYGDPSGGQGEMPGTEPAHGKMPVDLRCLFSRQIRSLKLNPQTAIEIVSHFHFL